MQSANRATIRCVASRAEGVSKNVLTCVWARDETRTTSIFESFFGVRVRHNEQYPNRSRRRVSRTVQWRRWCGDIIVFISCAASRCHWERARGRRGLLAGCRLGRRESERSTDADVTVPALG